jgi:hypothetical protein
MTPFFRGSQNGIIALILTRGGVCWPTTRPVHFVANSQLAQPREATPQVRGPLDIGRFGISVAGFGTSNPKLPQPWVDQPLERRVGRREPRGVAMHTMCGVELFQLRRRA